MSLQIPLSTAPKRLPRTAALAAFQKVSSLYAPAFLATDTDSDSLSSTTITTTTTTAKPAPRHPIPHHGTRRLDESSESDSDEFIDDLEIGLSRAKRTKILKKRKRVGKVERLEGLDREDWDLVAMAEGREVEAVRVGRKDGRKKKDRQRKRVKFNARFTEEIRMVKPGVDEDSGATAEVKAATGGVGQVPGVDDGVLAMTGLMKNDENEVGEKSGNWEVGTMFPQTAIEVVQRPE